MGELVCRTLPPILDVLFVNHTERAPCAFYRCKFCVVLDWEMYYLLCFLSVYMADGNAGPIFACNAEGCKKRFVEAAQLYTHARVHGDRPYVCHYDGCIKVGHLQS